MSIISLPSAASTSVAAGSTSAAKAEAFSSLTHLGPEPFTFRIRHILKSLSHGHEIPSRPHAASKARRPALDSDGDRLGASFFTLAPLTWTSTFFTFP